MKVKQIIENRSERSPYDVGAAPIKQAVKNLARKAKEFDNQSITPEQIELAYKKLGENNRSFNTALSIEEISDLAQELSESVGRSKGSWEFTLIRLHVLVYGMAPHGISESRAEKMFGHPSRAMISFAQGEDIDVEGQINAARAELKTRPVRIKRDAAVSIMFNYYKANKASLPKDVNKYREEIIGRLMTGMKPEQAFDVA